MMASFSSLLLVVQLCLLVRGDCPKEAPCPVSLSMPILKEGSRIIEDGALKLAGEVYPAGSFWCPEETEEIRVCACKLANSRPCLRKCCPWGELVSLRPDQSGPCAPLEPKETSSSRHRLLMQLGKLLEEGGDSWTGESSSVDEIQVIEGFENGICQPEFKILKLEPGKENPDDAYTLLANGTLLLDFDKKLLPPEAFCLDLETQRKPNQQEEELTVIRCIHPDESAEEAKQTAVNPWHRNGCALSLPFLAITFFVYALVPELRNIYGKTLMCYVLALVAAYGSITLGHWMVLGIGCHINAYIVHFSFLASFFWLNVMCFDIWWTFGGFRSLHGSVKQRERKKFIMYSIYAWGCASILTGICMIMDLVPGIPDNFIKPEFGKASCWFHTPAARALYFYGPMGLTIICNIILFILTALKISRHKKDTARQLKGSDSRRHDDNKQWFNLYLKLFIVMGINWSMEIISWLVEDKRFKYLWFITDLTNTLQGVIIFIIFVWKDKIKRLLMKRFGCESGFLSRNSRNGLTTNVTNSSAASKTTCVTSAGAPLHEKVNPFTDPFRGKSNANNSIATTTTSTANDCNSDANGASDVKDGVV